MPSTKLSMMASAVAASTVLLNPTMEPKALRSSQVRAIRYISGERLARGLDLEAAGVDMLHDGACRLAEKLEYVEGLAHVLEVSEREPVLASLENVKVAHRKLPAVGRRVGDERLVRVRPVPELVSRLFSGGSFYRR